MNGGILGASVPYAEPMASYSPDEPLVSSMASGPPMALAASAPAFALPLPEPNMTPIAGASASPMMSVLGAPPPPPVAPPPAPIPPVGGPAPVQTRSALPGAAGSPGMGVPGFGDFRSAAAGVGAEAARLARQPKLSEIGTIQENLATERERLAKGALEEYRTGAEAAKGSLEAAQAAEREASAMRAELAGQRADEARIEQENAAIERERRRQIAEDSASKLEAAQKELEDTKIDVEKAYGGTAGRILSAVAVAMGAFGASLTGGPNYALQIVNDRINRDLEAQRSELDKKKGKVSELGRLLQRNEDLLGNASHAATLTRAQTFKALADDVDARAKGRELTAQQAMVRDQLRAQQFGELQKLQGSVFEAAAGKALVGAGERAALTKARAAEALRQRGIAEKRAEKEFESGLKVQEALGVKAGERMLAEGMAAPGEAPPAAVEKVLENVSKPAIGTKDVIGALRSLDQFQQGIMAYGSPEAAPGGSTYGLAQRLTPDFREKARALTQTRTANILDYRRAQTGTAASEAEEKRIMQAAGGDDPVANMRWIQQQRGKLLAEIDTALKTVPATQRASVRDAILSQAGVSSAAAATGAVPMQPKGR